MEGTRPTQLDSATAFRTLPTRRAQLQAYVCKSAICSTAAVFIRMLVPEAFKDHTFAKKKNSPPLFEVPLNRLTQKASV